MRTKWSSQGWSGRYGAAFAVLICVLAAAGGWAQTTTSTTKSSTQAPKSGDVMLYAAVGSELTQYSLDVDGATLTKRDSVTVPAAVQYVWPHPSRKYLYVAWSDGGIGSKPGGDHHGVSVFQVDPASGALVPHGQPVALPGRMTHLSTDPTGTHLLIAQSIPSGVNVYRIEADGTLGSKVQEPTTLDLGSFPHQVRVDRANKMVIIVTIGAPATAETPEGLGALKVFGYDDGVLTNRLSIPPGGSHSFNPRHLDFHPTEPWVYVSLERQNKVQVFNKLKDETLSSEPLFSKYTVADPEHIPPGQRAGTIHVHPNGKFVYVANRASGALELNSEGKPVAIGREDTIGVFSINQKTGEPTLIQNIDVRGAEARTFALDPSGRILVAANVSPLSVHDGKTVKTIPAGLAVYRVRGDGMLDFVRKYDVETEHGKNMFWMGIVALP